MAAHGRTHLPIERVRATHPHYLHFMHSISIWHSMRCVSSSWVVGARPVRHLAPPLPPATVPTASSPIFLPAFQ